MYLDEFGGYWVKKKWDNTDPDVSMNDLGKLVGINPEDIERIARKLVENVDQYEPKERIQVE